MTSNRRSQSPTERGTEAETRDDGKEATGEGSQSQTEEGTEAEMKARKGVQAASGGGERGVHGELTDVVFFSGVVLTHG